MKSSVWSGWFWSYVVLPCVVWLVPSSVLAGGLFYAGSGTRALGRGAAFHVRADDPTALLYNPARLADLQGAQLLVNANLALLDACVNPAGAVGEGGSAAANAEGALRDRGTYKENYGASAGPDITRFGAIPDTNDNRRLRKSWLGTTMPEVCNETSLMPIPNLVYSQQLFDRPTASTPSRRRGLTIALGMVSPGAIPKTRWGGSDGSVAARGHASADQLQGALGNGDDDLGQRLPAGVRPDVVCNPAIEDCSAYCDPESSAACPDDRPYFCDPSKYECDSLPTPTRHMLVEQDPLALPLTLGVGYRPFPWLAIGGAFTYQAFFFNSVVYGTQSSEITPELDLRVDIEMRDYFVPSAHGSVLITPFQGLELMAYYKWQDAIKGKTKVTVTDAAYTIGGAEGRYPVSTTIGTDEGITMEVPQPWELGVGVRFALPRAGFGRAFQPAPLGDPMKDEVFDLEFDYVFERNAAVDSFVVRTKRNEFATFSGFDDNDFAGTGNPRPDDPNCRHFGQACTIGLPFPASFKLTHRWQNQHVFRVGGDYNVIPGVLALRAGYNFETRGVSPAYQSIDAFPARRQGIHGGLTWRVFARTDLSVAYAHLFQEQIMVAHADAVDASGRPLADRAQLRATSPEGTAPFVNAGTYRVHFDIVSVGLTQRF